MKFNYSEAFKEILANASIEAPMSITQVLGDARLPSHVSENTLRKNLKNFIDSFPKILWRISGFIPSADSIINIVEHDFGRITEKNLAKANEECATIVSKIVRPGFATFIHGGLAEFYDSDEDKFVVPAAKLVEFLAEDFSDHLRASGNGLVSVAGQLNEKLLQRALTNHGLVQGKHFKITGSDSEGDLLIHSVVSGRDNLAVEVKSYHARERLLRGLQDIRPPKIGVGFFRDASEFNPQRTITLIQAGPAAIYMPTRTLELISSESRSSCTNERVAYHSALYRPIENFATDMAHYFHSGILPPYMPS